MNKPGLSIIDCYDLESPLATEYRRLFQNVRRLGRDKELKSILVTSSLTGEGKSTISSLLGITAARKGYKTLVIDADLRRPSIHRLFAMDRGGGLVEVITEGLPFKNATRKTALENLDIVTAGKALAHPSELFHGSSLETLFGELKFYYDYVIIDSPPVIPVSDPMILSQWTDGVLVVIKAGSTAREIATRCVDILSTNQANLIGIVLNNSKNRLPYYYDYSHYHYDYSPVDVDRNGSDFRSGSGTGANEKRAGGAPGRKEKQRPNHLPRK